MFSLGGSCVHKHDSYSCICPTGFTGDNCESDIDDCLINPCLNGGSCIDDVNSFRCSCVPGFVGSLCQANVDDCLTKPCSNGGTCHDLINDYRCDCRPGFAGKDCSVNIDECESNPCFNGGTCEDLVDEFVCHCADGFQGKQCQNAEGLLETVIDVPKGNGLVTSRSNSDSDLNLDKNQHRAVVVIPDEDQQLKEGNELVINPTALLEIAHQVSDEDNVVDNSDSSLPSEQVALIVTLSIILSFLLVILPVVLYCRRRHRQKREQRDIDAEACRQNEQNSVMNNKCLDNQIINTLGLSGHKSLKMTNEGQDSSVYQKGGDDPLQRTKSTKLLNTDCTCSSRTSKMLDTDLEHDCAPRTLDRTDSLPQHLPSSKR